MKNLNQIFSDLEEKGYTVRGVYPKLKVYIDNNIYLNFNFSDFNICNVTYGGQELSIKKNVNIDDAEREVIKFQERIEKIRNKTRDIENRIKKEIVKEVRIRDARQAIGLSKIDFSLWLSMQESFKLVTATRAYTRKASDFIWVPSHFGGAYISHIRPAA